MARFAGQVFEGTPVQQKPVLPSFNAEDLKQTPEMQPGRYYPGQDLDRDKYIRHNPRSGVSMLPNGEQGPSQGANTPIKNYGGRYMPDGTQPSGYKHGPVALAPAIPVGAALIGKGMKAYGAFKLGSAVLDGGKVNSGVQQREPGQQREANPMERLGKLILRNDY